jgi:YidC/Oxa1 family membrane protein insertase
MPQAPNPLTRFLVPLVVIVLGLGAVVAVIVNSGKQAPAPKPQATTAAQATPAPQAAPAAAPASTPASTPAAPAPAQATAPAAAPAQPTAQAAAAPAPAPAPALAPSSAADLTGLRAKVFTDDPRAKSFLPLGSIDTAGLPARIEFSDVGAGVRLITLAEHFTSVDKTARVDVQSEASQGPQLLTPFAALGLEISTPATPGAALLQPVFVSLARGVPGGPVWRQVAADVPGVFEAFIVDASGKDFLRIERRYVQRPGTYVFEVRQSLTNLSGSDLDVRWYQLGPVDPPQESGGYGGDKRRIRFGHLLSPTQDPTRTQVDSSDYLIPHDTALGSREKTGGFKPSSTRWPLTEDDRRLFAAPLWPNVRSVERQFDLAWTAMIGRYFGVAVHSIPPADPSAWSPALGVFETVGRTILDRGPRQEAMALSLTSPRFTLRGNAPAELSFAVFAGPLAKREIAKDASARLVGLDALVVYNFGGMCGWMTFETLTHGLLGLMGLLHDYLFQDWSLSIIFLVVIVRTILHPVTRWSQIRMQRMGTQMQAVGPKQQKLQERYRDDPTKLREETAKLWREEGVSPAGFLGCLPMFLQMPVWIALYATLYFAQELRQQPAFYGLFQSISGHTWHFFADLSEPDHFLPLGTSIKIPLINSMMGPITAINVLPLILGVVFFIHQKYLTPPTATQLTPEQEMQQKIVKWMSVIMFPIFMYNAPCGLTLYFTTNSTFAIFENKWIRAHITAHDLLNPEKFKKKRDPNAPAKVGFMARLQAEADRRMKEAEAKKKKQPKR